MAIWNEAEEEALENELNKGALWAITYGDLMSYLFIFFLIMFVFTATKDVSTQVSLNAVQEQFGSKKTNVNEEILSQKGIQQIAKVELQQDRIRLSFPTAILFDEGYAELKPTAIPHLKRLAETLKAIPNPIMVEGHTDNVPMGARLQKETGFHDNWELSAARAFGVLRFLVEQGVACEKVNKVLEGRPHIVDAMKNGSVQLVFNTTEGASALEDSKSIRQAALLGRIPYYTTLAGCLAATGGIAAMRSGGLEVRPLQDYHTPGRRV